MIKSKLICEITTYSSRIKNRVRDKTERMMSTTSVQSVASKYMRRNLGEREKNNEMIWIRLCLLKENLISVLCIHASARCYENRRKKLCQTNQRMTTEN